MKRTHSIEEVAENICGDDLKNPVAYLQRRIRKGEIPARKIGRHWRMTDEDIDAALDYFSNRASQPEPVATADFARRGLSAASLRRRSA